MAKKRQKKEKKQLQKNPIAISDNLLLGGIITFFTWGIFFFWMWPLMLFRNDLGDIVAGWQYLWADWSAHFTYASYFAYRPVNAWFTDHPLFAGANFTYPFMMDAISGVLIKWGFDAIPAFIVPSVLATLLFLFFFYRLAFQFVPSGIGAFLSISIFLTGGGLIFLWYFFPEIIPILDLPQLHTDIIGWKNVIISEIVPQRAFLLGLPVALAVFYALFRWDSLDFAGAKIWQLILLGLLAASLLTIHVHSYIAVVITCFVYFVLRPRYFKDMLIFGASAGFVSVIIFFWMYWGEIGGSFFRFYPGWLANEKSLDVNFFRFWLFNWGIFFPFAVFAAWRLKMLMHPLVISGMVIFVLGNLMLFQPWDWDNSKLLTWSYLFLSLPAGAYLAQQLKSANLLRVGSALFLLTLLSAGGLTEIGFLTGHTQEEFLTLPVSERASIARERSSFTMFSADDLELARRFRELSEPTDTVLVADQVTGFMNTNTGRRILLGYRGWMWTYGIDYTERERDMLKMYRGNANEKELFKQYDISYVVIGHEEINKFQANEEYFRENYPLVLENANNRIYQVKKAI